MFGQQIASELGEGGTAGLEQESGLEAEIDKVDMLATRHCVFAACERLLVKRERLGGRRS